MSEEVKNEKTEEVFTVKKREYLYKTYWKSLANWAEECRDDKDLPFEERLMFRMLCYEMESTELNHIIEWQEEELEQLRVQVKVLEELK